MSLDVLAIAAHPDDVEQTCGGTLLRMSDMGYRTGVLDLTAGDMGTRGRIKAYDARDGKLLWTFFTIPGPGDKGHESWPADSGK